MLNLKVQQELGVIPSDWTQVDLIKPLPKVLHQLTYLNVPHQKHKKVSIYAENNLLMLSQKELAQLDNVEGLLRCILVWLIHSSFLQEMIMTCLGSKI